MPTKDAQSTRLTAIASRFLNDLTGKPATRLRNNCEEHWIRMNEAETRAEHIDPALKAAGWGVIEGSKILREHRITLGRIEGNGKRGKADIADYVLVYRNHKLGVIEAKAWNEEVSEGAGQAKDYADK